ncbi:hypothetical protein LTR53_013333 [Teratosphaeriaceae sp. CCFEE 6253]|nr:hypothetical protein LTR53_013333 [Teratosphaeriaceae sp. CCFEE 6253]
MAAGSSSSLAQLPDEMFSLIRATATQHLAPRLGRLSLANRKAMETPHYLAITSRGVVPHITQDTYIRDTSISGVYVGLEDFIERSPPPLYQFTPPGDASPLRRFIALPEDSLLVLGARRTPPVPAPAANPNTHDSVAVCTAVGFKTLSAGEYADATKLLQADIVVGLGDVPHGRSLGHKRIEKAVDRTVQWMTERVAARRDDAAGEAGPRGQARLFAPLLPVLCANQRFYIDTLVQELLEGVDGLAVYDLRTLEDLPEVLRHLPRLDFTEPKTPHEVLQRILMGMDVLTLPFVTTATDAGIALSFTFPAPASSDTHADPLPLGIDMWPSTHAVHLSPLMEGCECYACTVHHRAYFQHLLAAKEMLAWVLLQIHNHHVVDAFFRAIRAHIADGTFEQEVERFGRVYASALPESTGEGPRRRGYQSKFKGRGEGRMNKSAFTKLDDRSKKLAESALPSASVDAGELEDRGFAEKQ